MGFRDLPTFNLALLAKQGWQLLMKPESLYARVMKGKYFPHCDFMQAKKGKDSSHTWRAILSGRYALERGMIKRVGAGKDIKIWENNGSPQTDRLDPYVNHRTPN
jgi:hypothetical protein